jgi:hypothetical protein
MAAPGHARMCRKPEPEPDRREREWEGAHLRHVLQRGHEEGDEDGVLVGLVQRLVVHQPHQQVADGLLPVILQQQAHLEPRAQPLHARVHRQVGGGRERRRTLQGIRPRFQSTLQKPLVHFSSSRSSRCRCSAMSVPIQLLSQQVKTWLPRLPQGQGLHQLTRDMRLLPSPLFSFLATFSGM